ncbi:MAG: DinB family protein [Bacteroidota bacterium]
MNPFFIYATEQYELVKQSRKVLLDFCAGISPVNFLEENSSFGRGGSARNLLVHIANVYEYWIGQVGMRQNMTTTSYASKKTIQDIGLLFDQVDVIMYAFIERFKEPQLAEISYEINGVKGSATPLKMFSHVITHEFHHKGQVLSLSRHLGYVPVDTDMIR